MGKGNEIGFRVAPKVGRRAQSCNSDLSQTISLRIGLLLEKQGVGRARAQAGRDHCPGDPAAACSSPRP